MKTFQDYGIRVPLGKVSGQFETICPQCSHTRKKKTATCLSVNLDKNVWKCHHCGWSGGLKSSPETAAAKNASHGPTKLKPIADPPQGELTPCALKWLASRGISEATATAAGLKSATRNFGADGKRECVAFPFLKHGELVNVKYRRMDTKAFNQESGGAQVLFRFDEVPEAAAVIICEGELDALAFMEAGFNGVCSCPAGAPPLNAKDLSGKLAFLDDAAEVFDQADAVYLAMDRDPVGLRWEEAIADRIGREKCWRVPYPEGCKDANQVLIEHGRDKLRDCVHNAKELPISGIVTLADCWDDISSYFDHPDRSTGLSTGFPNMDEVWRLKRGTLNILTGIPQSGKSEWLDQIILNTVREHNWKWCVFSPENHPMQAHGQKLIEKWTGRPMFKRYSLPPLTKDEVGQAVDELAENLFFITQDENGMALDDILLRAKVCVLRYGIQGLVIDPFNELEHSRPQHMSETEYVSGFLSRCRNFARMYNVFMVVVAHPTKLQRKPDGDYPVPSP
ncbi:MAG: toprim domain-containing protein, partial [Spartobacteria bacterium]|nr:toprim domain-containing protein [Spartobacteria bacterium]